MKTAAVILWILIALNCGLRYWTAAYWAPVDLILLVALTIAATCITILGWTKA